MDIIVRLAKQNDLINLQKLNEEFNGVDPTLIEKCMD